MIKNLQKTIAIVLFTLITPIACAQITSLNITATSIKGCGTLNTVLTATVSFGLDQYSNYQWSFNEIPEPSITGNPSITKTFVYDPFRPCVDVMLTVVNSFGQTVTLTKASFICVYSNPTPNFTVSPNTPLMGCAPLTVQLFDNSTPGSWSNNIVSWKWLSMGAVPATIGFPTSPPGYESRTISNPIFTYNTTGQYAINLTVTDGNGCVASQTINNVINVRPTPKATITPLVATSCAPPWTIYFTTAINNYGATGITSTIDYGDNTPTVVGGAGSYSHRYLNSGIYTAKIITSGDSGGGSYCNDTATTKICIGTYSFDQSATGGCVGKTVQFNAPSGPSSVIWDFGDGTISNSFNPAHTYNVAGDFVPTIMAFSPQGCQLAARGQRIKIVLPAPNFSLLTNKYFCASPATPLLVATIATPPHGRAMWDFGGANVPNSSGITAPSFTTGTHYIRLTLTDSLGCSTQITDTVYVKPTKANFGLSQAEGCVPYQAAFSITGINAPSGGGNGNGHAAFPITSTQWRVDGNAYFSSVSSIIPPAYLFNNTPPIACQHTITQVIATANGCRDSVTKIIKGSDKPNALFSMNTHTTCASTPVNFDANASTVGTSGCPITKYNWNFGDRMPSSIVTTTGTTWRYFYQDTSSVLPSGQTRFDPSLVVESNGCKSDPARYGYVWVTPPIARFKVYNLCNDRLRIDLKARNNPNRFDNSIGDTFNWTITPTTPGGTASQSFNFLNPTNIQLAIGTYTVVLTVGLTGSSCTHSISKTITIANPIANMQVTNLQGCVPLRVNFKSTSSDTAHIVSYLWRCTNANYPFCGIGINRDPPYNATYLNVTTPGLYATPLQLIVTDVNGCKDTTTMTQNVDARGTTLNVTSSVASGCGAANVTLDASASVSYPLTAPATNPTFSWDFGNDGTIDTTGAVATHYASTYGANIVKVIAVNSVGCRDSMIRNYYTNDVLFVDFDIDSIRCRGQLFYTRNHSAALNPSANLQYNWSYIGGFLFNPNDENARGDSPLTEGIYTVCLTVTNTTTGCTASRCKQVRVADPHISFTVNQTVFSCAPVLLVCTNTSTNCVPGGYNWKIYRSELPVLLGAARTDDLGILLSEPGYYTIELSGTTASGCVDSLVLRRYIYVGGPTLTNLTVSPTIGCAPLDVLFTFNTNAVNASSVFNHGHHSSMPCPSSTISVGTIRDTLVSYHHIYTCGGVYSPSIMITDGACSQVFTMPDINVTNFVPEIYIDAPACTNSNLVCNSRVLNENSTALPPSCSYNWSFPGANITSSTDSFPTNIKYATEGTYTVCLTIQPSICNSSSTCKSIIVGNPRVAFTANQTTACANTPISFTSVCVNCTRLNWRIINAAQTSVATSNDANWQYTFAQAGVYSVELNGGASGCDSTLIKTNYITILPQASATASLTANGNCAPHDVSFHVNTMQNVTQAIIYTNDSTTNCTAAASPPYSLSIANGADSLQHAYPCVGTFYPTLSLINANGCNVNLPFAAVQVDSLCFVAPVNHRPVPPPGQIIASPNPATSHVILDLDISLVGSSFILTNDVGFTMISGILSGTMQRLDVHRLLAGVYYLYVQNPPNGAVAPISIVILH